MRKASMLVPVLAVMLATIFCCNCSAADATGGSTKKKDTWLIYWYICGSSLESGSENNPPGQATEDMEEMANFTFKVIEEASVQSYDKESSGRGRDIPLVQNPEKITAKLDKAIKDSGLKRFPNFLTPEAVADFPSNVKILIQTGGSKGWTVADIPGNTIGRYIYDNSGVHYQGSFADADMGKVETLTDFLRYGKETVEKEFNPTHRIFIFWNHGGLASVCYDERFNDNPLDLNEINEAFSTVFKSSPENPPFEIIGFDACIRATYENANAIYGFAKYMVASEENESDYGWYYTDWIRQLESRPSISGASLGQIICESSYNYLKEKNNPGAPPEEATFSVIDLSSEKWLPVRRAYDNFGKGILSYTYKYPRIMYTALDSAARGAERYAVTNNNDGYMIDLKGFAESTKEILRRPEYDEISESERTRLNKNADELIAAVESAVSFNLPGENKTQSNGLAVHYPLNRNAEELKLYFEQKSAPNSMKELYKTLFPELPKELLLNNGGESGRSFGRSARSQDNDKNQHWDEIFDLSDLINMKVQINEDEDKVFVQLTKEQMRKLSQINALVMMGIENSSESKLGSALGLEDGGALILGTSSNVHREWNDNVCTVTDKFDASWPMLNDCIVFVTVLETVNDTVDENGNVTKSGYTTYGIPLLINEEEDAYLLKVIYHHGDKSYKIVGATGSVKGVGRTSRGFTQLKKGDKITPILSAFTTAKETDVPGENGVVLVIRESGVALKYMLGVPFILESDPYIENVPLPDGEYGYWFTFVNPRNSTVASAPVMFDVYEGEILTVEKPATDEDSPKQITVETEEKTYKVDTETQDITEVKN